MNFISFVLLLGATLSGGSGILGNWLTPDHAIVRVYNCDSHICARLVKLGPSTPEKTDSNNPNPQLQKKSLCGLEIGSNFTPVDAGQAKDGHLYDPKSGKEYKGSMEASGDTLKLRGYIGISLLGRTEIWHRTSENAPPCQAQ